MNNIKKIVYIPTEKTFVIECENTEDNILKQIYDLSNDNQELFFNLWTACKLQVSLIKYLVYNHENETLYIEPLDGGRSVELDESGRSTLNLVLTMCYNF
jgi:hypothetical protein